LFAAARAQPHDVACPARSAQPTTTSRLPQSQVHSQAAVLVRPLVPLIEPACTVTISRPHRLLVMSFTRQSMSILAMGQFEKMTPKILLGYLGTKQRQHSRRTGTCA
jgi:hypothetical protein